MVTEWEMYWITRLDGFVAASAVFLAVCSITGLACLLFAGMIKYPSTFDAPTRKPEELKSARGLARVAGYFLSFSVVWLAGVLFIPSTKEYAAIRVIPKIATEKVGEDVGELYDLGIKWLKDKMLEDDAVPDT
jgi:hypothetical protein